MQTIYTYGAEHWCEDCGEEIRHRLDHGEGGTPSPEQLETETYDSADYPKPFTGENETDAPEHCAAREDCFNAITIPVPGTWSRRYGALITTQLTPDGIEYTADAIANAIVRPEGIPDVYSVALQVWWEHWSEEIREHWEKHYPKDIILDMLQSLLDYTSDRII